MCAYDYYIKVYKKNNFYLFHGLFRRDICNNCIKQNCEIVHKFSCENEKRNTVFGNSYNKVMHNICRYWI